MQDSTPPQTAQQFTNEAPSAHSSIFNSLSEGAKAFAREYLPSDDDKTVQVSFEMVKEEKPFLSQQEGRLVIEEVPYIRKTIPGNDKMEVHRPVFDADKRQFPYAWQQFERGLQSEKGTPLSKIGLDAGLIRSLHSKNVNSVEDLAQVSDTWIASLGAGARVHRQTAQEFLASNKPSVDTSDLKAQLEQQGEMLKKAMELIEKQAKENEELRAKKKPGRPPKAEAA